MVKGRKDPREYIVEQSDIGCEFKVKCTPVRSDGYRGEVFTSKSSGKCVSSLAPTPPPPPDSGSKDRTVSVNENDMEGML